MKFFGFGTIEMPIESPCTKVCVIEPTSGYCLGCGRTGEEIGGWIGYSPERRRIVMVALPTRLAALSARSQVTCAEA